MANAQILKEKLSNGGYAERLKYMYADSDGKRYAQRYIDVIDGFIETFGEGDDIRLFSAPGRTEIGGNHTDHQHGCVLAASVNLDVIAAVSRNDSGKIRIKSEGYDMDVIDLSDLSVKKERFNCASELIRGIAAKFTEMGYEITGFDAYTTSNVLKGSGLSSSAAFEVIVGTIINTLFASSEISAVEIAQIGQYAENEYFGKPCGLMDQTASSVGGIVAIDFNDTKNPKVEKIDYDFVKTEYALCIIDSGADHAELTDEYASIPAEMKKAAGVFGCDYLREIDKREFLKKASEVRKTAGDRAFLRAMHFFADNENAQKEVEMLKNDNFDGFLDTVKKSGYSSYMYLQNIYAPRFPDNQAVAAALCIAEDVLNGRGAYRVHGGGFAGTIQAFVPMDMIDEFVSGVENVVGRGNCHILSIRPVGGTEL
ncbi:MAG: galactokinase [Oscillospiraceae bacterium]|nr:galactokinase [Oscillospiraceae bacterium]